MPRLLPSTVSGRSSTSGHIRHDPLGLQLAEAKQLLQRVQAVLIDEQVRVYLAQQVACPACGGARAHKDTHPIVVRTLFGTLHLRSPRWYHCPCQPQPTRTFSPVATVLRERTTPDLLYLESKFAGLVSYGQSAELLAETLPLGRRLHASAVRLHALATGTRLERELGPEQPMFAEGCQLDWDELPRPDLPVVVGLDGGYVHSSQQRSKRDGWFEVIVGKSMPADGASKCFGLVQTYDRKPKRRLFEVLRSQGMQRKLLKAITEFGGYIRANASSIPNYGERYRAGEAISSAFVESTVNQVVSKRMVKKQQMRWTPKSAHLLLQVRTKVLNEELAGVFQRWYPAFVAPTESLERESLAA